jgi:hypothetical protein
MTQDERRGLLALAEALGPDVSVPVPARWLLELLGRSITSSNAHTAEGLPEELTQKEAAKLLRVSVAYLRASNCPKHLLPGNGAQGKPLVRYRRSDVITWSLSRTLAPPLRKVQ